MDGAVHGVSVPLAPGQEEHGHGAGVCLLDGSRDLANIREDMVIYLQSIKLIIEATVPLNSLFITQPIPKLGL